MNNKFITLISTCCAAILCLCSLNAVAAKSTQEAYFRCKDDKGQLHFGDTMPPECINYDTEVLSETGNVLRVIDGPGTLARKAANQNVEEAEQKAKDAATLRDRMLVEAYLSVNEIEALRDQRLGLLDAQTRVDEQNLVAYRDREQRILHQLERFRPLNTKPNALPVPDHLAQDMVNLINSRDTTNQRIAARQEERQALKEKFASDIQRFKELKGIK